MARSDRNMGRGEGVASDVIEIFKLILIKLKIGRQIGHQIRYGENNKEGARVWL